MARRGRRRRRRGEREVGSWIYCFMFPIVLFFFEVFFNFSTVKDFSFSGLIYTFFFSVFWGGLLFIIRSLLPSQKSRLIYTRIMLFVMAMPFLVEYFVYLQFKVLYDINTVKGGAGNVVSGFMADVVRLIFSFNGMSRILIFFLPGLIYCIFLAKKHDKGGRLRLPGVLVALVVILVLNFANIGLIHLNKTRVLTYTTEYNFTDAVANFGLYSGIRLDLTKSNASAEFEVDDNGDDDDDDDDDEETKAQVANETGENGATEAPSETETEKPVEYNAMDIDFDKLAKSDSGTFKSLDKYCASLTPSEKNEYTGLFKDKNLIFISAEAFSGDIIDPELTPTLYRLATKGINFKDFIVQATAGTTGGECENLFGLLPTEGGSSVKLTTNYNNYFTMGNQLNRLGYYGQAFHNNSYTMYDRNKTHNNLGYSKGFMGMKNGMEKYVTQCWPQSDYEMIKGTLSKYINKDKFNIYYMSVSGHSGYTKASNAMSRKNWDKVKNLKYSSHVKAYIACQLELERALKYLVKKLEEKGKANDTVIVISADHFPYGLDDDSSLGNMPLLSELYGYNVKTMMQRDHNTLIMWSGCLEENDPIVVDSPTSSIDILPTLSNLFGLEYDSRLLPGRDVFSNQRAISFNTGYDFKTDYGEWNNRTGKYTPKNKNKPYPKKYKSADEYVAAMKKIIRNKINFCKGELQNDYYGHIFGKNKKKKS